MRSSSVVRISLSVVVVLAELLMVSVNSQGADAPIARPVKLIFDTDMGNDIDDALALGVIHALQSRGECELLAVTLSKDNDFAGPFVDLVNTFYGRGNIPIGVALMSMSCPAVRAGPKRASQAGNAA